ncbi:MAG: hypothetical protein AB7I29_13820 [Geobacter sp.]
MKRIVLVVMLVVLAVPAWGGERIYSSADENGVVDIYIEVNDNRPDVYNWHVAGTTCYAAVMSNGLVSVVCPDGQEMMIYKDLGKVIVSRKGGGIKEYSKGMVVYGMYTALINYVFE